jgi:hypothetical protein
VNLKGRDLDTDGKVGLKLKLILAGSGQIKANKHNTTRDSLGFETKSFSIEFSVRNYMGEDFVFALSFPPHFIL